MATTNGTTRTVDFRAAVRAAMDARGLTQHDVVAASGEAVTQPQLSAWLAGQRHMRDDVLGRVLAAVGLEVRGARAGGRGVRGGRGGRRKTADREAGGVDVGA
ncbi:MAG: helix-turn-helix transcriptional regulator [Phycisphaerales bacterium]|nr:helix-turn-helix transcriptional regulator [Phycisphaerales bacterium]